MQSYLSIICSCLLFSTLCQGQITKNNSKRTFQCNYEILKECLIHAPILDNRPINFAPLPIEDTSQMTELIFSGFTSNTDRIVSAIPLFLMDTLHHNQWGNYSFYPNPKYFEYLNSIDATHLKQKRQIIGQIKTNALLEKIPPSTLIEILVQLPIIISYYHLHSDFVQLSTKETEDYYCVKYKVKWHICTNKCRSPIFRMAIKIDKKTGSITIIKK